MGTLRLVLGDQLSQNISSLRDLDPAHDVVLMAEVEDENTYVRHHKQKIVLVLSAMRHFAEALRATGITVDYVRLDDESRPRSLTAELDRAVSRHLASRVVVTEPGEWRVRDMLQTWASASPAGFEMRDDDRFLCTLSEFATWAKGRKSLRMEFFYRHMRRKHQWLLDGGKPVGGRWNYDSENRRRLPAGLVIPAANRFAPDATTLEVMSLVRKRFSGHFGDLESFSWAVTREQSLEALDSFVQHSLASFGSYQDAMKLDEDFLYHSTLSPYMNIGLLDPREVCEAALLAYYSGTAPLHSVEGFIRQILGWREFVRGVYWTHMPDYASTNLLGAKRPLPGFFWTGDTDLRCVRETVDATRRNAYAHHIQRLMVTGNFALLAGLDPGEVEEWYLSVYADAFEWVELPNTHGMALYADGGTMATKPYAASGAYIHRMSDYCAACSFKPRVKLGPEACPFNYLYWRFLIVNEAVLGSNPRMALVYSSLARMPRERREGIMTQADSFLRGLESW